MESDNGRGKLWQRFLFMVLLAMAYHLCGTLLFCIALAQFVMAVIFGAPNNRLAGFARGLGNYVRQLAHYLTFASDELPFPFSDWPSAA